jgi:hypothetical protein
VWFFNVEVIYGATICGVILSMFSLSFVNVMVVYGIKYMSALIV